VNDNKVYTSHKHTEILGHTDFTDNTDIYWLKPIGRASLYGYCTKDGSDDSSYDLQHLFNSGPFDFHFEYSLIVNKGHTDLTDYTDIYDRERTDIPDKRSNI